jgi:iron(III) transport system substrate-binding protein
MRALSAILVALSFAAAPVAAVAENAATITVYTSQPSDQMQAVIKAFNAEHPLIKVELFRSGTTEVMSKLQAELAAGRVKADVLLIADAIAMTAVKKQGELYAYLDAPVKDLPPSLVDPDKTFFGTKLITTGIMYNTRLVGTPPKSWADLTDKAVASGLIMPSPLYSGAAVIIIEYMALNARKAGSPVDFVFPSEGVSSITQPVAILKRSQNIDAAKVFVDWQLSKAAQQQSVEQGYFPILTDMASPAGYPPVSSLKIMPSDPAKMLTEDAANKKMFVELFGG